MQANKILTLIDKLLCRYLGLECDVWQTQAVQFKNGQLVLFNTGSFKRHAIKEKFDNQNLTQHQPVDREASEKLGLAIGKAIAKQLVVSFEETSIKRN